MRRKLAAIAIVGALGGCRHVRLPSAHTPTERGILVMILVGCLTVHAIRKL